MIGCQNPNILCFFKYDVTYNTKYSRKIFYVGELVRLGGVARLGEITFIPHSYGIFHLGWIKKIVWSSSFYNKKWRKAIMHNILILFN